MPGVFENILGMPSERIKNNSDYLSNLGPNDYVYVACVTNPEGREQAVGTAGLSVGANRTRHKGSVGIMVHRDYQGMGIGRALMEALLDVADNWLMLVRVELDVYTDNAVAIALYEKLGFVIEGTAKMNAIRNGEYVDAYMMARIKTEKR
jgi:putative acetyltransferase